MRLTRFEGYGKGFRRPAATAAAAGAVAWVTGKVLGFVDISMHRDPASMVMLLSFMTVALAATTLAARNRSFSLAAVVSAAVAAVALSTAYHQCYDTFRDTVYRNVQTGVMADSIDNGYGGGGTEVVEGWEGLSREELSREFLRFRLGRDRAGGFGDYMALVSMAGFTRTRGTEPAGESPPDADHSVWKTVTGQFTLTFALALLGVLPPTALTRLRELGRGDGGHFMPGIDMADIWTAMPEAWPARRGGRSRPSRPRPSDA